MNPRNPRKPNVTAIKKDSDFTHEKKDSSEDIVLENRIKASQDRLLSLFSTAVKSKAKFMKLAYDAYIEAGFSETQANMFVLKAMEVEAFQQAQAKTTSKGEK